MSRQCQLLFLVALLATPSTIDGPPQYGHARLLLVFTSSRLDHFLAAGAPTKEHLGTAHMTSM